MSGTPYPTIHQHPLAYLLGLEGVALMRAFAGEHDRGFTQARIAEVRALLDAADVLGPGVDVAPLSTVAAYDGWAPAYDGPGNAIFDIEERVMLPLLDGLPVGVAVDAACGTGRLSSHLAHRGHEVHGFDTSPAMVALARAKVVGAAFAEADLRALPMADGSADLVVCALALTHLPDLAEAFVELTRVLRPGGHLVVSDTRGHYTGSGLYPLVQRDTAGAIGYIPNWRRSTGDYLRAALAVGLRVRACEELLRPDPMTDPDDVPGPREDPTEPPSVWDLVAWAPAATEAAYSDEPCLIVWDFELTG